MRGAIIGFGAIAMGHMAGYAGIDELDVVAVVDVSEERRRHAAEEFGLRTYATFDELTANETLDFVDICTPPSSHTELSIKGLESDLHVLCEKPVFLPGDAGYPDLMRLIGESRRIFYPSHVYKFAPILGSMKSLTSAPGFGTVRAANFRTHRRGHAVGVAGWRPDWRREREISLGGILRDHGPHSVYLAMNMTGQTPVAVSCLAGRMRDDNRHVDTEDTAMLRLRLPDDAEISLALTWASGHRNTGYSIAGESGSVVVEGDNLTYSADGKIIRTVIESGFDDPSHKDWFRDMLLDFVDVVARPERQAALIREAVITALVIEAGYESAADGGTWLDLDVPATLPTARS
ncbi:Gfo/Idh/MocA family protein [Micromonospora chersina]